MRSVRAAIGFLLLFFLTDCGRMVRQPLNPPQLVTDAETDMSLQLFMQATIMLAKYYGYNTISYDEVQDRSTKAGFSALPFMPPVTVQAVPALKDLKIDQTKAEKYRDYINSPESIGYKGLVAYYLKTGLRASQLVCRNYLLGLDEKNQYLEFLKREFGVASTLADGILLAVSANGTLLNSFAISRDAGLGAINAYEEYRFLNIDREAARTLVETTQAKYAAYFTDQLNKSGSLRLGASGRTGDLPEFFTFSDALNAVSTIEYQCTRPGIRNLLNRAVNNTPTNVDVDRQTGTIIFKTDKQTVGTTEPTPAPNVGVVRSPEQPTPSKNNAPRNSTVPPP